MKVEMKKWEIARVIEIVSDVLQLWSGDSIKVSDRHGNARSMSKETFLKELERQLK